MIRLRITSDGRIRCLWTDEVQLGDIGVLHVERASHVEFDDRKQCWQVREAEPHAGFRRLVQRLLKWPCGRTLHRAATRAEALAWEHEHFGPGGSGWAPDGANGRCQSSPRGL